MIKSSRKLGRPVMRAASWVRAMRTNPEVALDTVRRRLELLLAATYGVRFEIAPVADDAPRNTFHVGRRRPIARHDGVSIKLPATMDASDGVAKRVPGQPGALKVRFAPHFLTWIPWVWGDYWVVELDPEYRWAVVGSPSRKYLWVLSRAPSMDKALFQQIRDRVQARGYPVAKLVMAAPLD